ncbi:MAG TPA: hypothetical protein PLE73_06870 [Spirochaetota bacterium]|nr:hypothetical protein [Spirochaetota bacterium]HPI22899.1 hypothetical protein [Spirochaetota bacterium]HPU89186.1 hypothetical protein [Spirochaetota bacterium]
MRIDRHDAIRIPAGGVRPGQLSRLQAGDLVWGKIVQRSGPRQALLDVAGTRVSAEFTSGVPREGRVLLVLTGHDGNALLFSRVKKDDPRYYRDLFHLTVFDASRIGKKELGGILARLRDGAGGLFELSASIARSRTGKENSASRPGGLLRALAALGVRDADLPETAFLLASLRNRHLAAARALLRGIGYGGAGDAVSAPPGGDSAIDAAGLLRPIEDALDRDGDAPRHLHDLLCAVLGDEDDALLEGEFAYEDDGPRAVRYCAGEDGCVVSIELSRLGPVEVLVRRDGSALRCIISCDTEEARAALAEGADELHTTLQQVMNTAVRVDIYKRSEIAQKIIEINALSTIHSVFDARV